MTSIKKKIFQYIAFISITIVLFATFTSLAFAQEQDPGDDGSQDPGNPSTQLDFRIDNPLGNNSGVDTLPAFIEKLLDIVIIIGIPIVVIFLIYAGFLFVSSRGNKEKLGPAKDALLYALIGAAVLLGAKVIASAIQGTINAL